jgi:hypothetical protein
LIGADPVSGEALFNGAVLPEYRGLAWDGEGLWTLRPSAGELHRINPVMGMIDGFTGTADADLIDLAHDGERIWGVDEDRIVRFDSEGEVDLELPRPASGDGAGGIEVEAVGTDRWEVWTASRGEDPDPVSVLDHSELVAEPSAELIPVEAVDLDCAAQAAGLGELDLSVLARFGDDIWVAAPTRAVWIRIDGI